MRCPRVASRTPDKDKLRCHYCKEFGHFIKNCLKRLKDEERAAKLHVMIPLTLQQETEDDNKDYYTYDDELLEQHTLKIKHIKNQSVVEFSNHGSGTARVRNNSAVGVLDLRS